MPVIAAIDGLEVAPQSHLDVEPRPADLHYRGSLVAVYVAEPGHLASFADRAALVCRPGLITRGPAPRPGRAGRATPAVTPGTAAPGPPRCPQPATSPRSPPRSSG